MFGILVVSVSSQRRGTMEMSGGIHELGPSGHVDDFARRNLLPFEQWPELLLDRPEFRYPEYLNAAVELTDRIVDKGWGDRIALIGNGRQRTYKELADWSNRLAHALVENYGVKPDYRRTQGDDAFPSRSPDRRRRLGTGSPQRYRG